MNRIKTGNFILELRKKSNMTQKDLAEKLGISDKTVSKWETGKSLPDLYYMQDLSRVFNVSINELLSGESISANDYSRKAEETIMTLIEERDKTKKKGIVSVILGVILLLFAIFLILVTFKDGLMGMLIYPQYFIDAPSIIFLTLIEGALILIAGKKELISILKLIEKTIVPIGMVISLISTIIILSYLSNLEYLGPSIAVAILTVLYALIIKIIALTILARKE